VKTYLRKGVNHEIERGEGNKKNEEQQRGHQGQRRKRLSMAEKVTAVRGGPTLDQIFAAACGGPIPEQVFSAAQGGPSSEKMDIPEGTAPCGDRVSEHMLTFN